MRESGCHTLRRRHLSLKNPAESGPQAEEEEGSETEKDHPSRDTGFLDKALLPEKKFCDLSAVDHSCKIPVCVLDDTDGEKRAAAGSFRLCGIPARRSFHLKSDRFRLPQRIREWSCAAHSSQRGTGRLSETRAKSPAGRYG